MRIDRWTAAAALGFGLSAAGAAGAGDAAQGARLYAAQCGMCHGPAAAGGPAGPALAGVIGRKAASTAFPGYSAALKKSGVVWTPTKLDGYLANPQGVVPGTSMPVAVVRPKDRADLIAYFAGLGARSAPSRRAALTSGSTPAE